MCAQFFGHTENCSLTGWGSS